MSAYYCVVTRIGAALEAASKAGGPPVELAEMAVGDGGGAPVVPGAEMRSLVQERWRGQLNDLYVDPDNPDTWIAVAVIPADAGGFTLREIGLFTRDGALYAVGNLAETVKPVLRDGSAKTITLRMPVTISPDAVVRLLIDPSTVLATVEYVQRVTGRFSGLFAEVIRLSDRETKTELRLLRNGLRDRRLTDRVAALERGGVGGIPSATSALPPEGVALSKGVTAAPLTLVSGDGVPPARAAIKALLRDYPETTGE